MCFAKAIFQKFQTIGGKEVKKLKDGILHSMPKFKLIEKEIFPNKCQINKYNIENKKHKLFVIAVNDCPYFFLTQDNKDLPIVFPNLYLVLQYPEILPYVYVDEGAVKPLLGGSNLKGPGIKEIENTAPFEKNTVIAIRLLEKKGEEVEHHEEAFAIGITTRSLDEIKKSPSGDCIEIFHVLKDQLWENREKIQ